jgi:hypothetical protein
MRTSLLASLILLAAACGSVSTSDPIDASEHDASEPIDASLDGPGGCSDTLTACGDFCVDVDNDPNFCGDCETACASGIACIEGDCAPVPASCAAIHAANPGFPSGPYTINPGTGAVEVYCDMVHGPVTYDQLGFGLHGSPPGGYTEVSVADLSDPVIQQAFIYLFNRQGGAAVNLSVGFTTSNCCFMAADSSATVLHFGGKYLYPATVGVDATQCSPAGGYVDASYRFFFAERGPYSPNPMPTDFFAANPATNVFACDQTGNPALFFHRF